MPDLEKYAGLLGVEKDAELVEIKHKYGEWRQKFEAQIASAKPAVSRKGHKNLQLLDQAFQALAAAAVARERGAAESIPPDDTNMSIELGHCRVGFQINTLELGRFTATTKVNQFKASWPAGKLTLYNNKLKIKALIFAAEIEYRRIDEIKRLWFFPFSFVVRHQQAAVPETVILYGPTVGRTLKRLNDAHRLGLQLSY